jgi:hypothetical protein
MTWFKVDDNLAFHHKTVTAGVSAMGLWVRAGSWCAQTLTDGFVPEHMVPALPDGDAGLAGRLVEAGLWRRVKGGFAFHEWSDRQPVSRRREGEWRAHIPQQLREQVYARDRYRCRLCGSAENLSLDHFRPWLLRGTETLDNLQTLCTPCNSRKGVRLA